MEGNKVIPLYDGGSLVSGVDDFGTGVIIPFDQADGTFSAL
jgi:hypothetical protein